MLIRAVAAILSGTRQAGAMQLQSGHFGSLPKKPAAQDALAVIFFHIPKQAERQSNQLLHIMPREMLSHMRPATNGALLLAMIPTLMLCLVILMTEPIVTEASGAEVMSRSESCKVATGASIVQPCFGIQLRGRSATTSSLTLSTTNRTFRRFTTSLPHRGLALINGRLRLASDLEYRKTTTAAQLIAHTRC